MGEWKTVKNLSYREVQKTETVKFKKKRLISEMSSR